MKNVIAILFFAVSQLFLDATEPNDCVLSQVQDWSSDGTCEVMLAMNGFIFEFGRFGQRPVYLRSNTTGVYISMDSRMRGSATSILRVESDVSSGLELFLGSIIAKSNDVLKRRGIAQLKEVIHRGKQTDYDAVVFNLVFGEERAVAYERVYDPSPAEARLLAALLKDRLNVDELKILEDIAMDRDIEPFTAYSSALFLFHNVGESEKYDGMLKGARQRVLDAYIDQDPKVQWRGGSSSRSR